MSCNIFSPLQCCPCLHNARKVWGCRFDSLSTYHLIAMVSVGAHLLAFSERYWDKAEQEITLNHWSHSVTSFPGTYLYSAGKLGSEIPICRCSLWTPSAFSLYALITTGISNSQLSGQGLVKATDSADHKTSCGKHGSFVTVSLFSQERIKSWSLSHTEPRPERWHEAIFCPLAWITAPHFLDKTSWSQAQGWLLHPAGYICPDNDIRDPNWSPGYLCFSL